MTKTNVQKCGFYLFLGLCLLVATNSTSIAPTYQGPDIQIIGQEFYKDLESEFQLYRYQIDALDEGVPPLILQTLPSDLHTITSSQHKKRIFFKSLLPMVLLANDEIRAERQQLEALNEHLTASLPLDASQLQTISVLAERYKVKFNPATPQRTVHKLLDRVDIIPADLALAQAANESAWGTSRFSQVANNLFGEWTFIQGQGIVPEGRPEGETYEVQKFSTVYDSVRSYLHNLNTHSAYQHLRKLRSASRRSGINPKGSQLAEGLVLYSARGKDYVKELQAMIRTNQLNRFAGVKLRTRKQLIRLAVWDK
ncbi:glucosaminidase domain-containing protein [uncultured Desulfuromusa sp.]|uniref:glucosaminidase domain-containing protein n=1 Tax=uncultured Desulfuromusa sp. TaxID=219183 RepID=UPI002AA71BBB|nr:glucosaminidase domain-containing protein [uncultured Desulfuromusa sp.]